ncbi:hypothetical protein [Streptomyces sp. NPDC088719]|uniref:hypothetical protein n=1 Tax=Streptomyces sp. NPDC088719 TaxID=3365872 RepID=UPI003815C13C
MSLRGSFGRTGPNLLILTHQTGKLRILEPSKQVRRLLEISGVDSVLEIRQAIDETAAS